MANIDISVTITNYIMADSYTVHVYRRGSVIPLVTKEESPGAGANVVFKELSGDNAYEVEVIHNCPGGKKGVERKIATSVPTPAPLEADEDLGSGGGGGGTGDGSGGGGSGTDPVTDSLQQT